MAPNGPRGSAAFVSWAALRCAAQRRFKAGKEQKRATGGSIGGPPPYAYVSTASGIQPNPELAPIVRRIFEEARDGYSPGRIAKGLNADGVESPSGRAWNRQTVRNIVENVATPTSATA